MKKLLFTLGILFVLTQITQAQLSVEIINVTHPTCYATCDGTAIISVTGGVPPYTFSWSNGEATQNANWLCEGMNTVTVSDANSTIANAFVPMVGPVQITLQFSITQSCDSNCLGATSFTIYGGMSPYAINWSNGETEQAIDSLCSGNYTVTLSDVLGCTIVDDVAIPVPTTLEANASITNVSSVCGCDGAVQLSVLGGVYPYTYLWSNGDTLSMIENLNTGEYCVTVTDQNQCTLIECFNVSQTNIIGNILVDSTTTIKVCFSAEHTYVSDLGFYLVAPDGVTSVALLGYNDSFNSGDDVQDLCFSTEETEIPDIDYLETPLTGTYASSGEWSSVYGFPFFGNDSITWTVQIYDCQSMDIGTFTNGVITFTKGNTEYIYDSGEIYEPINDNACIFDYASTFTIPLTNVNEYLTNDSSDVFIDTLYSTIENCEMDVSLPVDSAFMQSYSVLDSSTVEVEWVLWQGTNPVYVSSIYNYSEEGVYSIYVTVECDTSLSRVLFSYFINETIEVSYDQVTSSKFLDKKQLKIYPNPANEEIYIDLLVNSSELRVNSYKIFTIDGKKVLEGKLQNSKTRISTKYLENGIYFIEVGESVTKVVIVKN